MNTPPSSIPPDEKPRQPVPSEQEVDVYAETLRKHPGTEESAGQIPEKIGRFDIQKQLGVGAFGEVYLGYDSTLDRKVAIKVPRGDYSEENIQSFLTEAKSLAQLQHPGIVAVYDVWREGNRCYIVTEYLKGSLLKEHLTDERLDWLRVVKIVAHLAEALGHAHSRGIMHRDIKPSNIMMTPEGRCVLLDFGLAVNDLQANRGEVAGTPSYMSPEQVRGESHRVDGRTDIYSLGVVLYELLTGKCPFRAGDVSELFRKIKEDAPQPIRQLNPDIPASIDEICLRTLEKDLSKRYTTAGDLARALFEAVGTHSEAPTTGSAWKTSEPAVREDSARHQSTMSVSSESLDSSRVRRMREAELRLVTLLSASFDVSQRRLDAEAQHEMSERFSHLMESVAEKFGGRVSVSTGHEFEVCFGFPVAFEDSVSRAVHCGMELFKQADADAELPNRSEIFVAVHMGQAVAEESPSGVKVTGDVSLVLRRLMAAIDAESVTVTETVHKTSRMYFEQERLGEISIRGLTEPMMLYRVLKDSPVTLNRVELVDPGNLTPLVGRDTELTILKDRWEQALEEMGQVVLLIGEAGLGKSRLIREIREHVVAEENDPDIIELRCSQYHQSAGLYPMVEHLTQLLKFDDYQTPESRIVSIERYLEGLGLRNDRNVVLLASLLSVESAELPALEVSPQRKRELTASFQLEMLQQRSESRPVLFIVEDLHWVDPTLLELLSNYVEQFDQSRVLSIFTFRPEFETPWRSKQHQTQIALNRLTRRQIRDMMQKRLGRSDVPDAIVDQIVERTDGIPLFIEEFTTLLAETNSLDSGSPTAEFNLQGIPTSLQDLLMARLDRMSSDPEVIQLASAIGREFTFSLLAAASDLPPDHLEAELSKLAEAEVLFRKGNFPDASFIFKHALIQDSAYNSLLKKRRQEIHSRIGTALEENFVEVVNHQPELLAHHFTEAGNDEKAIGYWLKAGQRAQSQSANVESINHFERGLAIVFAQPESVERSGLELGFQLGLSVSLMAVHGYAAPLVEEKLIRAQQLCSEIGPTSPRFPVTWASWASQLVAGKLPGARNYSNDLLAIADGTDDSGVKAEAHLTSACTGTWTGEWESALSSSQTALDYFDLETSLEYMAFTGQNVGVMASQYRVMNLWHLGLYDQALAAREEGIQLTELVNHPFSSTCYRWHVGLYSVMARHAEMARFDMELGLSIATEHGFPYWAGMNTALRGAVHLLEGDLDAAVESLKEGIEIVQSTGAAVTLTFFKAYLVDALRELGRTEEAKKVLLDGFQQIESERERFAEIQMFLAKARLEADCEEGQKIALRAVELAQKRNAIFLALRAALVVDSLGGKCQELIQNLCGAVSEGDNSPDMMDAKKRLGKF